MIVLDNYTTIDKKILLDPSTFHVKIVDDSYTKETIGVGGFVEDVFLGVYVKNDLLHFCCNGKIYSANSDFGSVAQHTVCITHTVLTFIAAFVEPYQLLLTVCAVVNRVCSQFHSLSDRCVNREIGRFLRLDISKYH